MSKKIQENAVFDFFRLMGDEVCLACSFFKFFIMMIYEKKEQAGYEIEVRRG